ncbi:hypothetical protein ACLB2K_054014 [Fragaria x ananassa]
MPRPRLAPREREKSDEGEAKLYVCTYEFHFGYVKEFNRYRVHAIKLSDLFSFDLTPIPMFSSQSDSKLKQVSSQADSDLQQVAVLEGEAVPINMGIGVFGSRIILAGGCYKVRPPARTYVLETDQSVEPNPRFISCMSSRRRRRRNKPPSVFVTRHLVESDPIRWIPLRKVISSSRWIPGLPGGQKFRPWLGEIDSKLYALSGRERGQEGPAFQVFDPKTRAWASLPSLPTGDDLSWGAIRPSNVAVVGTKIFVTLRTKEDTEGQLLCFDVADPKATWSDREPRIRDDMGVFPEIFNKVLVVDSQEEDEKLIFSFDYENILVSRMVLSAQGETDCIELVAKISLSGELEGFKGTAYSCVHLGGQKVCFAFFWVTTLLVLTFNYSYSKSTASPPLPRSASEILTYESICGSFSVQTLGLR